VFTVKADAGDMWVLNLWWDWVSVCVCSSQMNSWQWLNTVQKYSNKSVL